MKVMNDNAWRHDGGWTLMHMLLAIGLLGVFTLMSTQLFMQLIAHNRDSVKAIDSLDQWRGIERQLRADVWDAASIDVDDDGSLLIEGPGGDIVWRALEEPGRLQRDHGEHTRYFVLPPVLSFHLRGGGLLVRAGKQDSITAGEEHMLVMLSQRQWLEAER